MMAKRVWRRDGREVAGSVEEGSRSSSRNLRYRSAWKKCDVGYEVRPSAVTASIRGYPVLLCLYHHVP